MFIIGYMPMWALVVIASVIILSLMFIKLAMNTDKGVFAVVGYVLMIVGLLPMVSLIPAGRSYFAVSSNNYNTVAPGFKMLQSTKINKEKMNDFLADSIDADKVSVTENVTMENVKSGEILDFTGFKDDAKVTGNVYFKDDTMVIFVDDGSVSGKTVNIALDK